MFPEEACNILDILRYIPRVFKDSGIYLLKNVLFTPCIFSNEVSMVNQSAAGGLQGIAASGKAVLQQKRRKLHFGSNILFAFRGNGYIASVFFIQPKTTAI